MSYVWMAVATLLSGILGAMGMGGGGILIIYLTLFSGLEQHTAQGINLLLFIPCAIIALLLYFKKGLISWKTALLASALGLLGAAVGTWLSGMIDATLLRKIFGGMLAIIGLLELFGKQKTEDSEKGKEIKN